MSKLRARRTDKARMLDAGTNKAKLHVDVAGSVCLVRLVLLSIFLLLAHTHTHTHIHSISISHNVHTSSFRLSLYLVFLSFLSQPFLSLSDCLSLSVSVCLSISVALSVSVSVSPSVPLFLSPSQTHTHNTVIYRMC